MAATPEARKKKKRRPVSGQDDLLLDGVPPAEDVVPVGEGASARRKTAVGAGRKEEAQVLADHPDEKFRSRGAAGRDGGATASTSSRETQGLEIGSEGDASDHELDHDEEGIEGNAGAAKEELPKRRKKLSRESLEKLQQKYKKRGVVYLSRIPPHMKPAKLRHLLSQYGEVLRVYLAPEDPAIRMRRKRAGGNSGKQFTEAWVEFAKKKVAKQVAEMLNGQQIGGPRRSAYHFDLWNIKYLKKFKWDHLTEEIAYRNAVREQRLAAEVSTAKKERDFYLAKVDQSRAIEAMAERKRKRGEADGKKLETAATSEGKQPKVVRRFPQRAALKDGLGESKPRVGANVLSKVLGSASA